MKKLFLLLVLVAAVLFGGKIGLEYYYAKKLDQLIAQARFVADIDYRNIRTGTDGSISINGLSINPYAADTLIRVETISLFSSDILLPVKLANLIRQSEVPDELGVRVANLDYDPSVFEPTIDQEKECRYLETTLSSTLIGINRLNSDIEMSLRINANNAVLSLSSADQVAIMNMKALFDASMLNPARVNAGSQPIKELTFDYKLNEQLASKLIETCANRLTISTNDYLNKVVGRPEYLQILGVDFGSDANQALVKFLQGGQWLSVKSKPSSQLSSLNDLGFYKANDIVRLLGLTVTVDATEIELNVAELPANELIDDQAVDPVAPEAATLSEIEGTPSEPGELSEEQQRIELKKQSSNTVNKDKYSYKITSVADLNRFVNYLVIVKRSGDKKPMSGELISIGDEALSIETGEYGGRASFTIAKTDVVEVQVYR